MDIVVSNLPAAVTEEDIREIFRPYGSVQSVNFVVGGVCFVEMSSEDEARLAIGSLNGYSIKGRQVNVNVAAPPPRDDESGDDYNTGGTY